MSHTIKSFAKLNLCLYVFPPQSDGYHPLWSIFQEISLYDTINYTVTPSQQPSLHLTSEGIPIPVDRSNTITKLFEKLKPYLTHDYTLHIQKHIPLGSGMGGASSNAAAFIKIIKNTESLEWNTDQWINLSSAIGADIPFFLKGGSQLVKGIGDQLSPLKTLEDLCYVIIYPMIHCSTPDMFKAFDASNPNPPEISTSLLSSHLGSNDLLPIALSLYKKMKKAYESLTHLISERVYMTGSGSTFFIPMTSENDAYECKQHIKDHHSSWFVKVVHPIHST